MRKIIISIEINLAHFREGRHHYAHMARLFASIEEDRAARQQKLNGHSDTDGRRMIVSPPSHLVGTHHTPPVGVMPVGILLDENMHPNRLEPLTMRGITETFHIKRLMPKASDQVVLDYARRHNLILVTLDRDFENCAVFDHSGVPGTLVLPAAKKNKDLQRIVQLEMAHFMENFYPTISVQQGIIASYHRDGRFTAKRPMADNPSCAYEIASGNCLVAPH